MRGMAVAGWVEAEIGLELGVEEVQLWRIAVSPEWVESGWAVLNAAERVRASRYVVERAREEFVAGRGLLRRLVGGVLGCAPEEVVLGVGEFGKPWVRGVEMSVSHSGGVVLVGLSRAPLGVDVERVDGGIEALEIARGAFGVEEVRRLEEISGSARVRVFYEMWVRKEAVLKARGVGIGAGVGVRAEDGAVEVGGETYRIAGVGVGEGYCAAVAAVGERRVRWLVPGV